MNRLAIVIPCYNEEEILRDSVRQLRELLCELVNKEKIAYDSTIILVDDGSTDGTWSIIRDEFHRDPHLTGICLAANAGQQNAIMAGLTAANGHCDMAVTLDADLQDDIDVMEKMIDLFENGAEVVYGVRSERKTDTVFKRTSAHLFYRVMDGLGAKTVYDHAEYRLLSARALRELLLYDERNLFLRGVVPMMGFCGEKVYYSRKPRKAGKSKYSLGRMISTAFEGITSLSIRPITMVLALGMIIMLCSLAGFMYILFLLITEKPVTGWLGVLVSVWFLGGLQLTATGLIGEYTGKTYIEVKHRPRYHVECLLTHEDSEKGRID